MSGDLPEADVTVDARGRRCPLPVIDLAKAVDSAPAGAVVAVLSDDPAAATDVPAWCRMRDVDYLGERPDGDATAYLVRRP
ncbi:MAG TPA: sulfurtransferase TusA family protein [Mycobacteriales bacterium]|nr:sulfurtransferase TusA family protein [Mycobacteriales bacterium]